jgi:DNA topoisomerase II
MRTPIVKATRGTKAVCFYTKHDYDCWKQTNATGWTIKYYKGLGTSTANEARAYFSELRKNTIEYVHQTQDDPSMELAFKKTLSDARKEWIREGTVDKITLDHTQSSVSVTDFINHDLRWFSIADNERSIPSMVDGLKPSQRKVLYACRKRAHNQEIKVSQLAGVVSVATCYHHGEQSMMSTIVGMAQDFVGSNNINLLQPKGQFGTRLMGGKDAASPRYIFTQLSPLVSTLFHAEDDQILAHVEDDGIEVEPVFYLPTLPLVLINGSDGIGTGFSTSIPCFNPSDVKANVIRCLQNQPMVTMIPWYKGFKGTIEPLDASRYTTRGAWATDGHTLTITELPIGRWSSDYKELLEHLVDECTIASFQNHCTDTNVRFQIKTDRPIDDVCKTFKLSTIINTCNMHCFDEHGVIRKYASPLELIQSFVSVKLRACQRRKDAMLTTLQASVATQQFKLKFMRMVMQQTIRIFRESRRSIDEQLRTHDFPIDVHDTLLRIRLDAFTDESIQTIEDQLNQSVLRSDRLANMSPTDLWMEDIQNIHV